MDEEELSDMKRIGKRKLALALAVCLLLGMLAGCGKKDNAQQLSANVYVPKYLDVKLNVDFVQEGCSDGENIYLVGQKEKQTEREDPSTGDKYIFSTYTYSIYRIALDTGAAEELPGYVCPAVPEGKDGNAGIASLQVASDGTLWVREYVYVWGDLNEKYPNISIDSGIAIDGVARAEAAPAAEDAEAGEDAAAEDEELAEGAETDVAVDMPVEEPIDESQEMVFRRHLDAQGNELESVDLTNLNAKLQELVGEDAYIGATTFDSDGNIYAVTETQLYVLDPQMNLLFTLEGKDMWSEPVQLGGGVMGMQSWEYDETAETSTNYLRIIDREAQDWGPSYIMPQNAYSFYPGGGDYLCYYQANDAVFGFKAGAVDEEGMGAGEGERLFSWVEADINSDNVRSFFFLPDGRVAAVTMEWPEDGKGGVIIGVAVLTSTPRDQLPEKTTLVYATMYLSYDARRRIIDFNKKSDQYRIEVKDYSEYVTGDDDGSAALQKLNTEILAGSVPDILDTSSLPIRQYGAKGVLEDLWPYIDKDPDLGRDALMLRPLEANQQDGKLYEIFSSFSIRTAAGPGKIIGDRLSWTLADLQAALEEMPEGCSIFGESDIRDDMLSTVMSMNMDRFVDWDTGKCSFDSEDFKALLSFCGSFPAEFSWDNVDWDSWEEEEVRAMNGKQLLIQCYLSGFDWDVQRLAAIFNNDFTFIGYPKEDGGCGSSFMTNRGLAMSSACRDKEGAWSFIRQLLLSQTEDGEAYYGNYPVNKTDFDKMVAQALEPRYETDENGDPLLDEEGQPIPINMGTIWISGDMEVPMRATTQEDVDKIMELYNAIDSIYRYDEKIFNAVQEVAGQYFAGDKPLDDAAALIQSKVSLYVNESR